MIYLSLDDLRRVILEIDSFVKSSLLFAGLILLYASFCLFLPVLLSILWLLYLFYSIFKLFLKWKKILRLLEINACR